MKKFEVGVAFQEILSHDGEFEELEIYPVQVRQSVDSFRDEENRRSPDAQDRDVAGHAVGDGREGSVVADHVVGVFVVRVTGTLGPHRDHGCGDGDNQCQQPGSRRHLGIISYSFKL